MEPLNFKSINLNFKWIKLESELSEKKNINKTWNRHYLEKYKLS